MSSVAARWRTQRGAARSIADASPEPLEALRRYPDIFRGSLASNNRMCLSSFMAAEYIEVPEPVRTEVQAFADVNAA